LDSDQTTSSENVDDDRCCNTHDEELSGCCPYVKTTLNAAVFNKTRSLNTNSDQ
ncbi:hypothetical protein P692DRAFT_20782952, partial [Suillus brevipes Sb2]